MRDRSDVILAGEHLQLLAARALHWPEQRLLAIADLHLGKDDVFRAAGIAVPSGGTRADLTRLSALLEQTRATRLLVLGDFIHGRTGVPRWRDEWRALRERHPGVSVEVVLGNHDRGLNAAAVDIEIIEESLTVGPFRFLHEHQVDDARICVSGHVHPIVRVPMLGAAFPVFHLQQGGIVLPAFSAMTGGWQVAAHDAWLACVHDQLLPSPAFAEAVRRRVLQR